MKIIAQKNQQLYRKKCYPIPITFSFSLCNILIPISMGIPWHLRNSIDFHSMDTSIIELIWHDACCLPTWFQSGHLVTCLQFRVALDSLNFRCTVNNNENERNMPFQTENLILFLLGRDSAYSLLHSWPSATLIHLSFWYPTKETQPRPLQAVLA